MATSSYASLFGTTGAGQQGSRAGIGTLFGQQARPEDETAPQGPKPIQPQQTFAQLQRQGMARPAPQAPQGQPFAQFGGSQQAQQVRTGMLGALQQQLAAPTRFDTEAFQKIRQAQSAQLGAEYQAEQSRLNEELARRGLSASSIGGGRMGDLAGQQARALAQLDAQLLQQAAQTQAQDRLAALQAAQGFSELAGAQDLAQFEANRVAQAAEFQQGLQAAQFGQQQTEFERGQALQAAQLAQTGQQAGMELALRQQLGLGELTGQVGGQQTLAAQQQAEQRRQFDIQQQLQSQLGLGGLAVQQREVDLRAQQLQQEAAQQGRAMSLEEARLQVQQQQFGATQALEQQRLAAQQQQFGAQLGFNREELALRGELGRGEQDLAVQRLAQEGRLQEAQQAIQLKELGQRQQQFESTLNADEQRFVRTLKEQQDARAQQLGISTRQLDQDAARLKQEAELQGRQLTLQEARDLAEVDYRTQSLAQQAALQGRSLDIEQARNEATLGLQRDQLTIDEALRREGISVDRERLTAAQRQFDADLAQRRETLTAQTAQADLDRQLRERLGAAELTGTYAGQQTLPAQQAQQNLLIQLAGVLAGGGATTQAQMPELIRKLYAAFGIPLTGTGTVSAGAGGGGGTVSGTTPTQTETATSATIPYEGGTQTVRSL